MTINLLIINYKADGDFSASYVFNESVHHLYYTLYFVHILIVCMFFS